ncbi:START-like domain-containing protein [Albibacterium indicum]|uniref:START-like domain-containing protein n=1 Tax=Albibacterium indicum TaxID=2292082 RepID=UPI000E506276|nr:START-like domain-containing protein [Pedobacter indicus]
MPEKVKIQLEYEVKSAPKILFSFLNEPNALAQWFADEVTIRENIYTFQWHDDSKRAKLVNVKDNKSVRYKWIDDEPYYFELEIVQDELTNDVALAVTDFVKEENLEDRKLIWDNSIDYLSSVLGA